MLDVLNLPDRQRVVLDSPPLALALCQVKFPLLLDVTDPSRVAPFQRAIRGDYPIAQQQPSVGLSVSVGGAPIPTPAPSFQWRFMDTNQGWTVVLAQDFLAIETRNYARFEDFLDRLQRLVAALAEHLQPQVITRIGLRYINEIRGPNLNWSDVISRDLLGPLAVEQLVPTVKQSLQQLLLDLGDNQAVNLNHGLLPEGTTVAPLPNQQAPSGPFYLLDLDVYRAFLPPDLPAMEAEGICYRVQEYHRVIYRLFRWALTDAYLETLGGRPHED